MRPRRREQGYVLLTAMLLAVLVVTGSATYCRFALNSEAQDAASLQHHLAHEAALSGLSYARQALASGGLPNSLQLDVDDISVTVNLSSHGAHQHMLRIDALRGGLGTRA